MSADGYDTRIYDLMNLATAGSLPARLIRTVCAFWGLGDPDREGPRGPRIGTLYVEDSDGLLALRLVTRMGYEEGLADELPKVGSIRFPTMAAPPPSVSFGMEQHPPPEDLRRELHKAIVGTQGQSVPPMSLEEALAHAEERGKGDSACAAEHRQLAGWLRELKGYRALRKAPDLDWHLEPDEVKF